jgi:enamine deaminase RidA (YjgF/YER057c/UK114 family)
LKLAHTELPAGRPQSYSSAVSDGTTIYTAGQLGAVPGGPAVSFADQAEAVLTRLVQVIEAAGGGVETIVKVNAYLASMGDFAEYDEIYRRVINTSPMPARTTVQVGAFIPPLLIELDAIALRKS